jgi:leucyl aminopeptidase
LKTIDLKKNIFLFEINSKKKFILISIKKDLKSFDMENLGAELYGRINHGKDGEYFVNSDTLTHKNRDFISHFLH